MRALPLLLYMIFSLLKPQSALAQTKTTPPLTPVAATVCEIFADPAKYNNKMVRVRGTLHISPEYSVLSNAECSQGLWFGLGEAYAAPGLVMVVVGTGRPGGRSANGKLTPPIHVQTIQDAEYRALMRYFTLNANSRSCVKHPPKEFPPDCRTYVITATFTGRIDSVSQQVHAKHLQDRQVGRHDGKGFGQMGLYEAELVAGRVEEIVAIDSSTGQPAADEGESLSVKARP